MGAHRAADGADEQGTPDPRQRYRSLPEPVRLADTVEGREADPVPDPTGGRDPEWDVVLRYAG